MKGWASPLSRTAGRTGTGCTYEPLTVGATTKNQILGFCYDAAGNLYGFSACDGRYVFTNFGGDCSEGL